MYVTASKETRKILTTNWSSIEGLYKKYNSLMNKRQLSAKEKHTLDDIRRSICVKEFDLIESPQLRLQKYLHIGDNSKRYECDAVVQAAKQSKKTLMQLTRLFQGNKSTPGEIKIMLKLAGRLIINHTGGVLENAGLCLHPHAGIPYIPGSAVKGVARHTAWCEWADTVDDGNEQKSIILAKKIALIFGFPTGDKRLDDFCKKNHPSLFDTNGIFNTFAGLFAFMPAMPVEYMELVTDIVNCHHSQYYNGKQQATDNERPNPQFFPAVEKGAMFEFRIRPVLRIDIVLDKVEDISIDEIKSYAEQSVRIAAVEYGFGAKTSNGYGWFCEDKIAADNIVAEIKEKEEEEARKRVYEVLSDEEKQIIEWQQLSEDQFSGLLNKLEEKTENEKREILRILQQERVSLWKSIKKAKKGKKLKRLEIIKNVMVELGIKEL